MADRNPKKNSEESNDRKYNSESEQGFENENEDDGGDYLSSINQFNFYNSLNPPDPLLPKPLYKPKK